MVVIAGADGRIEWINDVRTTGYARDGPKGRRPGSCCMADTERRDGSLHVRDAIAARAPLRRKC